MCNPPYFLELLTADTSEALDRINFPNSWGFQIYLMTFQFYLNRIQNSDPLYCVPIQDDFTLTAVWHLSSEQRNRSYTALNLHSKPVPGPVRLSCLHCLYYLHYGLILLHNGILLQWSYWCPGSLNPLYSHSCRSAPFPTCYNNYSPMVQIRPVDVLLTNYLKLT